jgi:S1-C subfamily serine protease
MHMQLLSVRGFSALLCSTLFWNHAAFAESDTNAIANSVVKVFSTIRAPEPFQPWTKRAPYQITGSGVVIGAKRILSNAHVVLYASQIQIQGNQSGDKISATVEAIAPGIDLAVLKVDDESFFDSHPVLPFSKTLPNIKDAVLAYGYPEGGNSLSITKGIVSRIEFTTYNAPVSGLRIQIDAAINPGNSGGPAVVGERMIGLAFSHLNNAQNIGYIIPTEEIELFLQDVADGHYDGKPAMFADYQTLENAALRDFLGVEKSTQGLIIRKPDSTHGECLLKQWDIVTRIGDTPVDNQGMIKLNDDLRVAFNYLVQKVAKDGKVPLTIIREKKEIKIQLPVSAVHKAATPDLQGAYPSYFICGPLAFSTVTTQMTSALIDSGDSNYVRWLISVGSPMVSRSGDKVAFDDEELVVVTSPFFPHKLAKGYSEPYGEVVKTVNGIKIKNLAHLVEVLRDSKEKYLTFEFDARVTETLVFPRTETLAATEDILRDNGIRSQGSTDMMAIWESKMTANK